MEEERLAEDTLFLALTRPAMFLGVPLEGAMFILILTAMILLLFGNPLYALAIGGSLILAARLIVRTDYNMFKILMVAGQTKARARNKRFWGGSSYTPLPLEGTKRKGFGRE